MGSQNPWPMTLLISPCLQPSRVVPPPLQILELNVGHLDDQLSVESVLRRWRRGFCAGPRCSSISLRESHGPPPILATPGGIRPRASRHCRRHSAAILPFHALPNRISILLLLLCTTSSCGMEHMDPHACHLDKAVTPRRGSTLSPPCSRGGEHVGPHGYQLGKPAAPRVGSGLYRRGPRA